MKNNFCDLYQLIPKEELTRVFRTSTTASAELDPTFLGFEDVYKAVSTFVQKDKIIIDLGCSYAAQAFYFTDFLYTSQWQGGFPFQNHNPDRSQATLLLC